MYIYPLFFGFPFHLGHHKALSRVPCAIECVCLVTYFINSVNPNLSIHSTPFPPWHPCICPIICTSVSALQIRSSHSSVGKESACNARDPGLIPGSERSAGEGIGYPL